MAQFIPDTIDFAAYMASTEADHRVVPSGAFADEVVDYFHGDKVDHGQSMPWEKTVGRIAFRPGEVTLWGGMNGHGKSLVLGQLAVALMLQKKRTCIASLEMRPVITLARICRQASGTNKPEVDFIREFHEITDKWIWLYDQQGAVNSERMLAVMRYCAQRKEISHFILDSFMKCGLSEDDYTAQKLFIDAICTIARDTGMHVHLVAHSRKARDENSPPGKMDVKGSGSITDQVDNVITVWRNKAKEAAQQTNGSWSQSDPDCLLICDKQRNGEWEGRIALWYEPASQQFVEHSGGNPMNMLAVPRGRSSSGY